jgi:hypothetical protein
MNPQLRRLIRNASSEEELDILFESAWPYVQRTGRAFVYAAAGFLLYWLQPHFEFSSIAFALAIFLLSMVSRGRPIAEAALLLMAISIFVPAGLLGVIAAKS